MNLCTKYETCVLCDYNGLDMVFELRPSALAEDYRSAKFEHQKFPLELYLCKKCKCLQLLHSIDQAYLFRNYTYQSVCSPGLVEHFKKYAESLRTFLTSDDLIIDIGSNDGTLLNQFMLFGFRRVVGVEPSAQLCHIADVINDVRSYNNFFTPELAKLIESGSGKAKLITANNVFAHSRNLGEMADAVFGLLADDGQFIVEVSYLPLMIQNMVFDFVYHEHLCYHRFEPLQRFFQNHNMRVIKVETHGMKGGSARFTIVKASSMLSADESVHNAVMLERDMQLDSVSTYTNFYHRIESIKRQVQKCFRTLEIKDAAVVAFGASATTTTLLHHFGIGNRIAALIDDNPGKIGKYSPGYNIPVLAPQDGFDLKPDYVFIAAWRFINQIIEKHGCCGIPFIVPLPQFRII